jgi:tRNA U54 and U55 pseudouridine synthase Pus10
MTGRLLTLVNNNDREEHTLKKALKTMKFEEMKNKTFEVVRVTVRLCEICDGTIDTKERLLRTVQILSRKDYENFLIRSKLYDRAEVDPENNKVYLYDHEYPGDVHPNCIKNYEKKQGYKTQ